MTEPARIEFVNHACVIIDTGDCRILCDPWLSGRAFDDGWELVAPTGRTIADLDFTHIWISHEHPDHFSPRDLRALPADRIEQTPLLYQTTADTKLVDFCAGLGYQTQTVDPDQRLALTDRTAITLGISAGYDSWLLVQTDDVSILNLNDCRMDADEDLESIRALAPRLDVLLTQFGYANWVGNPADDQTAGRAATMILDKFQRQLRLLEPAAVIPFASFVRFCHTENSFWNAHAVTLDDALSVCERVGTPAVTLFPGDQWPLGSPPPADAAARWQQAFSRARQRPLVHADSVGLDVLDSAFAAMQERVRAANDWQAIIALSEAGNLPASPVFVTDLNQALSFDLVHGLTPTDLGPDDCDIRVGSEALHNVLRFNWGRGTLTINGRFVANYPTLWRFLRQTQIAYANNIGWRYPDELTTENLLSGDSFLHDLLAGI